jgi:hypothetical protein
MQLALTQHPQTMLGPMLGMLLFVIVMLTKLPAPVQARVLVTQAPPSMLTKILPSLLPLYLLLLIPEEQLLGQLHLLILMEILLNYLCVKLKQCHLALVQGELGVQAPLYPQMLLVTMYLPHHMLMGLTMHIPTL